jgi:hypothetical protein
MIVSELPYAIGGIQGERILETTIEQGFSHLAFHIDPQSKLPLAFLVRLP